MFLTPASEGPRPRALSHSALFLSLPGLITSWNHFITCVLAYWAFPNLDYKLDQGRCHVCLVNRQSPQALHNTHRINAYLSSPSETVTIKVVIMCRPQRLHTELKWVACTGEYCLRLTRVLSVYVFVIAASAFALWGPALVFCMLASSRFALVSFYLLLYLVSQVQVSDHYVRAWGRPALQGFSMSNAYWPCVIGL